MKHDCRQHHPAPRTASLRRTCSVCGNIVAVVSHARRQTASHSQTQRDTARHNDTQRHTTTHTHTRARAYRHHCTTSHRMQQSKPYLLDHGKATKPTTSHRAATRLRGRRISAHSTDMVAQLQPIVRQLRVREGERFGERMLCCPSTHRTSPCHAPRTNTPHHTTPRRTTPRHATPRQPAARERPVRTVALSYSRSSVCQRVGIKHNRAQRRIRVIHSYAGAPGRISRWRTIWGAWNAPWRGVPGHRSNTTRSVER